MRSAMSTKNINTHIDNVANVTIVSRDRWLATAQVCPYATYFHTPYWYELIAPNQKHTALEVTFSDGASAVIPLVESKRLGGLFTSLYSSPGGTYGGWISASALNKKHVNFLLDILNTKKLVFLPSKN